MPSTAHHWWDYAFSALILSYCLYLAVKAHKNRPVILKSAILYQEWFASGHSEANLLTKFGGTRNCLRLIVTSEYLIVTSWFPFLLFSAFYDMEHVIPLQSIVMLAPKRSFGKEYLSVVYQDKHGKNRALSLDPKNWDGLRDAILQNAKQIA